MIQSMGEVSFLATDKRTKAKFNFSEKDEKGNDKIVFKNTKPDFEVKKEAGVTIIESPNPYGISAASDAIVKKIRKTENYEKYFSGSNPYKKTPKVDGANLTLYIQFTLKSGYALSSEVAHITSEGLSIQLILSRVNSQTWE